MIKRGEIYYIENTKLINGNQQAPDRLAVIVSNDMLNATSSVVELVYITTTPWADLPTHVSIRSTDKPSVACCEQVYSMNVSRLKARAGELSREELRAMDAALAISMGIDFGDAEPQVVEKVVVRDYTMEELDDLLDKRNLVRRMAPVYELPQEKESVMVEPSAELIKAEA